MPKRRGVEPGSSGQAEGNGNYRGGVRIGNWVEEQNARDFEASGHLAKLEADRFSTTQMATHVPHTSVEIDVKLGPDGVGAANLLGHGRPGAIPTRSWETTTGKDFRPAGSGAAVPGSLVDDPSLPLIERVRRRAMKRGARGIVGLSRSFRIMDDDRSFKLSYEELKKGLRDYGFRDVFTEEDLDALCAEFDANGDGSVAVGEFLEALRPPMDALRRSVIEKAWRKADVDGDGQLTVIDLEARYDVSKDPRFLRGDKTKDQLFRELLDEFDVEDRPDGIVTREEFTDYYSAISAGIDDSAHFDLLLRNAWKI